MSSSDEPDTSNVNGRYIRQIPLIGQDGQDRLSSSTVFIAGAGGLASPVATYLALAGIGEIIIADGDRVEESNLNRQFLHGTQAIGKQKAYSAISTLQSLNPEVSLVAVPEWIDDSNAEELMRDANLVIDALDSYQARFILNRSAHSLRKPLIHGAVEGYGGQMTTIIPGQTPCLSCLFPSVPPVREKTPVFGATAGMIGSMQALEAVKYLTGKGTLLTGKLLIWDGLTCRSEILPFGRRKSCPVCSCE